MRMRTGWALLVVGMLVSPAAPGRAEPPIEFELYSWRTGSNWYFSVLEGTATARGTDQIKARTRRLKGTTLLKGRLASLAPGEWVHWRSDPRRGLVLPSKEVSQELERFAEGAGIRLILPEKERQ